MASLYRKPIVIRDPKTGQKIKTKSKKWWGRYRTAAGPERRVPLTRDKSAAQAMLNELVTREERKAVGIIDRFDEHYRKPLASHVADYRRYLEAKENSASHVGQTDAHIKKINTGCRFKSIPDISASRVARWLADLREKGRSIRTSNSYLIAIKGFTHWLVRDRRAREDMLAHLSALNNKADIRRERRTLEPSDLGKLIAAARPGKPFRKFAGPDRAVLYQTAMMTGLRAGELASLTPQSFDLDGQPPTVTVEAAYSKHRRRDVLPLHPDLAATLRDYLRGRPAGVRLWKGGWANRHAAIMIRHDLDVAGIPYRDDAGRVFDFHSLRHQFISDLARGGAHPKETQTLARHSTITLTMDRYTHLGVIDLVDALNRLPAIARAQGGGATGTNG